MRVGDRVSYVGDGSMGKALMQIHPQGAIVFEIDRDYPAIKWPSGGLMIVGEPSALLVTQTLEEIFATG